MKLSTFTDQFFLDLQALGKLGGPDLDSAVSRLIPTLEPVLRTRLMEVMATLANEVKDQLPSGRLEARINGEEVELVYLQNESVSREIPSELNARITLRLPEDLKSRIEKAATKEGISLNSWLLKASDRGSYSVSITGRQLKGKGRS
jgi:HicB family